MKIYSLNVGDIFTIPSLNEFYDECILLSKTPCSCLIEGIKKESGVKKHFKDYIANSVEIEPTGKSEIVVKNEDGVLTSKAFRRQNKNEIKEPKNNDIAFPSNVFTIKELAEFNNKSYANISNWLKKNQDKVVVCGEVKNGKRGKAAKQYKLKNND